MNIDKQEAENRAKIYKALGNGKTIQALRFNGLRSYWIDLPDYDSAMLILSDCKNFTTYLRAKPEKTHELVKNDRIISKKVTAALSQTLAHTRKLLSDIEAGDIDLIRVESSIGEPHSLSPIGATYTNILSLEFVRNKAGSSNDA